MNRNLQPLQFSVHAGKYGISYEPGSNNSVQAQNLDETGNPSGRWIGYLNHDAGGTVGNVHVREDYRRQGIASAMLDYAKKKNPDLSFEHSSNLTSDGVSWANSYDTRNKGN